MSVQYTEIVHRFLLVGVFLKLWAQAASLRQQGRYIDFIILDDKCNAIKSYEVISKTANKMP